MKKPLMDMQTVTFKFHWVQFIYSFISRHTIAKHKINVANNWTCAYEVFEVQLTCSLSMGTHKNPISELLNLTGVNLPNWAIHCWVSTCKLEQFTDCNWRWSVKEKSITAVILVNYLTLKGSFSILALCVLHVLLEIYQYWIN